MFLGNTQMRISLFIFALHIWYIIYHVFELMPINSRWVSSSRNL